MLPECLSAVWAASIKQSANEMPGAPLFTGISEGVDSGILYQNIALARLAVLLVLSAAYRLVFGKVKPLYFDRLKYGCPEPRVFRASPRPLP